MNDYYKKQLNKGKTDLAPAGQYDLSVMKPFVKFGLSAMSVIGHALVGIVKAIPKPHHNDEGDRSSKSKIIKI